MDTTLFFFNKSKKIFKDEYCNLPSTILNKPFIEYNNYNSIPEIIILRILTNEYNLKGFWVDTFHKKIRYSLDECENIKNFPIEINNIINQIIRKNNNKISGCWDLVLYDDFGNIKFVEIKGIPSKDKLRLAQMEWYENSLKIGLKDEDFLIVVWDYNK